MSLLIRNATVLTFDPGDRVLEDGALIDEAAAAEAAWGRFVAKYGGIMAR